MDDIAVKRHLTDPQRGDIGKHLEVIEVHKAKERQKEAGKTYGKGQKPKVLLNSVEAIDKHHTGGRYKSSRAIRIKELFSWRTSYKRWGFVEYPHQQELIRK